MTRTAPADDPSTAETGPAGARIVAKDLHKTFQSRRGAHVEAVRGISLTVGSGEIFAFLGPNGAGETTGLRMLTTLLPIDIGTATVPGFDVRRSPQEVRRRIGYVSQPGCFSRSPSVPNGWACWPTSTALLPGGGLP